MIAELLSDRQKCVMPSVISSNQTAFIAGRQILEGFMIANEVVHCLKRRDDTGFIFMVMQSLGLVISCGEDLFVNAFGVQRGLLFS